MSYNCENAFFNSTTRTIMPFILGSEAKLTVTYTSNEYDSTTGTYRTYTGTGRFLSVEAEPIIIESIKVGIGKTVDYTNTTKTIAIGDMGYYIYAQAILTDDSIRKTECNVGDLTFQSTDSSKLLVTEKTGYLVPIAEGNIQLLVYDGETIIADYEVQIIPARKPVRLALSQNAIKLTKGLMEDTAEIELIAYDQYGSEIDVSGNISITQAVSTSSTNVDISGCVNGNKIVLNGALFHAAGTYIVRIYLSSDGTGKTNTIGYKYFEITDTQVPPVIEVNALTLGVDNINDNSSVIECFTVNGESISSINNIKKYVLTNIDKQFVDPILWVKSITLLEYFTLDGQNYYIEHTAKVDAMITTY